MLQRINTWQVIGSQLAIGCVSTLLLAVVIHFPHELRRPMPPPGKLLLALIIFITIAIITLGGADVRSTRSATGIVIASTVVLWFLAFYGVTFVWINTYGT
jgi:hypothetical protein